MEISTAVALALVCIALWVPFFSMNIRWEKARGHTWFTWWKPRGHPTLARTWTPTDPAQTMRGRLVTGWGDKWWWQCCCCRGIRGARAIAGKAPRHRWHPRQSWQCRICNLQNLKGPGGFESHPLRPPITHSDQQLTAQGNFTLELRPG
jgi:hypothetical protein